MEISSTGGLPQLEMEDPTCFLHQWHLNFLDDPSLLTIAAAAFEESLEQPSFSSPSFNSETCMETSLIGNQIRPTKQQNTNNWSSNISDQTSSGPQFASSSNVLSFFNSNFINQMGITKPKEEMARAKVTGTVPSDILTSQGSLLGNQNYMFKACERAQKISSPKVPQPQDHIIAERKRRERLSQRFIALSALLPGLKKTDKATVLGDAIKYLKQLKEKVKVLEEEQTRAKSMQSVVIVKKCQLVGDVDDSYSDSSGPLIDEPLPEIEARYCDRNVLIRIHCEKKKEVVEKTMTEIEKLHLIVTNSSIMTFGSSALDITIIAQMDVEFCMTLKDLVRNLRSAFGSFM
ncbi:hypothetical protein L6164_032690 [Bauhinia variegata]|uniref:Uncharacterized protein n=1 Tax=Bauhinia variegata TaxID=167791 RepID=A0ACB9KQ55_BAUVA|nr:hypothetical protein L6164_032690 [Bauhinia variegata]